MARARILTAALCLAIVGIAGPAQAIQYHVVFDASPLVYGAANALLNGNKKQQQQRRRPVSNRQHLIGHTRQFPGSYYVKKGVYYYQPPRGRRAAPPEIIENGSFAHVDDLATRLEYELGMMCLDIHDNYSHNVGHSDVYRQAFQVWQLAQQMHSSDEALNETEVAEMIHSIDPLFQPVRREVNGWSRRSRRQHGQGDLQSKIVRVEALTHHLMNSAGPVRSGAVMASKETPVKSNKAK